MNNHCPSRFPSPAAVSNGGILTLADVIARVEAQDDLQPRRKRDMVSAVRTVCRLLHAEPDAVSAELRLLRKRLEAMAPAAAGIGPGRWNNIRSLTMAALKAAGIRAMPGGLHQPLLFAWKVLRARLPDKHFRCGLSRLMTFCSMQGIVPGDVDAALFERFRQALETESLVRQPKQVYKTACALWNRAAASIAGWPPLVVAVPDARNRYRLVWDELPAAFRADVGDYLTRIANQDVFADDYAKSLRPATVELRRVQVLQIATGLVRSGFPVEKVTGLAVLVEPDNAKRSLQFFHKRAGDRSTEAIYQLAILLRTIARHRVKASEDQVQKLGTWCQRLAVKKHGMTQKNRSLLRQFDERANVDALLLAPERWVSQVRHNDKGGYRDAQRVMYALVVELLTVAPIRIKNLTSLEVERHFVRTSYGRKPVIHLVIPADEVKNGEPYEVELPQRTAALLDLYLKSYRGRIAEQPSIWLFPNQRGERRSIGGFSARISTVIFEATGLDMHVHLFRQLAVKLYYDQHPEDVETGRRLLGHKSLATTFKSYAELSCAASFRRYDGVIESLRDAARGRRPMVRANARPGEHA